MFVYLLIFTTKSVKIALITAVIFTIPSLGKLMPNAKWWRFPLLILLLGVLSVGLWQLCSWVPPAALRLTDITLSHQLIGLTKFTVTE